MDYCPVCRRYLNGALACPGCGVPAAARRAAPYPYAGTHPRSTPAYPSDGADEPLVTTEYPVPAGEDAEAPDGGWDRDDDREGDGSRDDEWDDSAQDAEDADVDGSRPPDRRSRRGRRAHRRKRRRVLLICAGLVLASGALSLAQVSFESPFHGSGGASALDEDEPSGPAASADPATSASASATSASAAPSGAGPSGGVVEADATDAEDGGGHSGSTGHSGASTSDPGNPPTSNDPPPGASQPPTDGGTPDDPDPSQSCTWVIVWWCS